MAGKKKKEEIELFRGIAISQQPKTLVLEGDPESQLAFAMKAANALMQAVKQKKNPVMIRGEQYLEYGDWQTLARFFGATASVAWSKKLVSDKNEFVGYEARAEVLHNGVVISAAEAMCMRNERNWKDRDEFMLRSMAQTRASAKALRNAYGWVAELAGMKATPAEEMGDLYDRSPIKASAVPVVVGVDEIAEEVSKPKVDPRKAEIKRLCDNLDPLLETANQYKGFVLKATGLDLEAHNYDQIIERLKAI